MRPQSAPVRALRFRSHEYQAAIAELKSGSPTAATVITFAGGSSADLRAGAEQLARSLGRTLFRVDLSGVVSKYIGETEKNLDLVFARADAKAYVLFFEDADALFGPGGQASAGQGSGTDSAGRIAAKLADYRGFIVALLRQPPLPTHGEHKIRRFHISFPPA